MGAARVGRLTYPLFEFRRALCGVAALLVLAVLACAPAIAAAALPPHVNENSVSPDGCAICHRAHTSNVPLSYRTTASVDPTGNALIIAPVPEYGTPGFPTPQRGDVGLCFTCHGAGGLGSQYDVETSFTLESTHSIAPLASAFGPSPKMCGDCHDPHGTERVTVGGAPYPKLLRSWVDTTTVMFSKEEYCAACHKPRAASRFDSLTVYKATGHYSGLPDPANGTKIRCSNCHVAHGSSIAPLVVGQVVPPAAPATLTVAANDRRLCIACHPAPAHSWSGETTYALSAHAIATTTVPIPGEWPTAGAKRKVGECQVCHAPMGRTDGGTGAVAKLLEKSGRALCDDCHKPGGPAKTDLKSLAYPTSEGSQPEIAITWGPTDAAASNARVAVYGRATSGTGLRPLVGPREFAAAGAEGAAAAGDIDGDGQAELVVGNRFAGSVTVFERDPLLGLVGTSRAIGAGITPDLVVVGRFVEPTASEALAGSGARPQIAIVDITLNRLWLYENMVGTALTLVPSGGADDWYALPDTATSIAAGDFAGIAGVVGLAVAVDGATDQLLLYAQDGATHSQLAVPATSVPVSDPRGVSVGDLAAGAGDEIVVCDTLNDSVEVYDGAGASVVSYVLPAGDTPWASAVGNALASPAGNEIAVAVRGGTGASQMKVIPQVGLIQDYPIAATDGSNSGSVLVADVEGDGIAETLVGDAGSWNVAAMVGPAVRVYRPDGGGTALALDTTLYGGGSELAGSAPALASADFGPVGPSRHPVDVVASHVSTETGSFARHVTCSDCHSSHEASSGIAAAAPLVTGNMRGAWGTAVTNTGAGSAYAPAPSARAVRQYEVCLKCHATTADGREDVASKVNSMNPSVHAVEGVSAAPVATAGSYVNGWGNGSVLYCTSCHGNSAGSAEAIGTHRSAAAPLLQAPVLGLAQDSASLLCYRCHNVLTYYTGATDGAAGSKSNFYDGALAHPALHRFHSAAAVGGMGFACSACHVSHGSATERHLLRGDVGFTHEPGANLGECTNACHGALTKAYDGS